MYQKKVPLNEKNTIIFNFGHIALTNNNLTISTYVTTIISNKVMIIID